MFRRLIPLALAAGLLAVVACSSSPPTPAPTAIPAPTSTPLPAPTPTPSLFPFVVTGSDGVSVTLQEAPRRIVAIESAAVEILFAMGYGDRIAATHTFVDFPPEAASVARVGSAFELNFEQIADLKPDLIYIFFDRFVPDLRKLGAPVLYLKAPATFSEAAAHMRMWGRIAGDDASGEKMASDFEATIASIRAKAGTPADPPSVYQDVAPGYWTLGKGSLADEVFRVLGAENVFADIQGAKQVSPEEIVARAPDAIVVVHPDGGEVWRTDAAFASLPAVREGRICEVDPAKLSVPGTRLAEGVREVGECLYPDRF